MWINLLVVQHITGVLAVLLKSIKKLENILVMQMTLQPNGH